MFWRRKRAAEDIAEELRSHIELEREELLGEGVPDDKAANAAHRTVGNVTAIQESLYERSRWMWWESAAQDLRYGLASLGRNPGYAVAAILTLALGIGANSAIFSVVHAVLLKPLPFSEPSRIVVIEPFRKDTGARGTLVSAPDFHDFRRLNGSLSALAYHNGGEVTVVIEGTPLFAQGQSVTVDYFKVFGLPPSAGRFWDAEELRAPVAVIGHRLALERFGGVQAAPGKTLRIGSRLLKVVGVAAEGFSYPGKTELWVPSGLFEENPNRSGHNYFAVGRLAEGVSSDQVRRDLERIAGQLESQYPENKKKSVAVTPVAERLNGPVGPTLWLLMGSAFCVLLIACANVANLQFAHQAARTREIAVRVALGAGQGRVVRQLLTESLLLAALGSAMGLALGWLLLKGVLAAAPSGLPGLDRVELDGAVLGFAFVLTGLCGSICGLGPARLSSRTDLTGALRQVGSGAKGALAGEGRTIRVALVISQIALSVVLVAAAGSLARYLYVLARTDLGFQADRILLVNTVMLVDDEADARRATAFFADLRKRAAALPGVRAAAGFRTAPFAGRRSSVSYSIAGGPQYTATEAPSAQAQVVTPDYFEVMSIPLRSGRDIADSDVFGRPQVAVINRAFARQAFGSANPIGRRILCGLSRQSVNGMEIVGVVDDARQTDPGTPALPEMFVPAQQHPSPGSNLTLAVKTGVEPYALSSALRETLRSMNPALPVKLSTMNEVVSESRAYPRFRSGLVGLFSLLALGLSTVGVYGVISYLIARRTNEVGLRLALGASPWAVYRLIVGGSLWLISIGLAVGAIGSGLLAKILAANLPAATFDARDPGMLAVAVLVIMAVSIAGASIPAVRAARVDPLAALRHE